MFSGAHVPEQMIAGFAIAPLSPENEPEVVVSLSGILVATERRQKLLFGLVVLGAPIVGQPQSHKRRRIPRSFHQGFLICGARGAFVALLVRRHTGKVRLLGAR